MGEDGANGVIDVRLAKELEELRVARLLRLQNVAPTREVETRGPQ